MTQLAQVIDFQQARAERQVRAEGYVSKARACSHFGVCERTIERWVVRGMPSLKPYEHGLRRFRLGECEEWLRAVGRG